MIRTSSLRTVVAAAALNLLCAAASAANYRFSGSVSFSDVIGAAGTAFNGSFSVDQPASNFTGEVLLKAFSFSFGGQTYTLGTAGSAPSVFFDAGQFSLMQYGAALNGSSLDLATGFPDAWVGTLSHTSASGQFSTGSFQVSAVPEPEGYALMLGGLGLVGWLARRRKA